MPVTAQSVVFVTGATSGFGLEIARRFYALGARVVGTGRRQERLDALAAELGPRFLGLCFDVGDRTAVEAAVAGLPAEFAAVDVLVNNAGLALGLEPAHRASLDDWETMVRTNCLGVLYVTRLLVPAMVERGGGHVVNLSSVAASWPYPGSNVYGASKAFLTQFSLNLKTDTNGTGVRVTDIEPGLAETEFSLVRFKGDAAAAAKPYENVANLTAADIAESVVWAVQMPAHVNINRIEIMATNQAWGPFDIRRG